MKPILLVQNDPVETFGLAIRSIESAGVPVMTLDSADRSADRPRLEDLTGVVMFGGTMNVDEVDDHPFLKENRDLTRECVDRAVPYLGICLGSQMLARAMDAPVMAAPVKEVGFEPVRVNAAAASDALMSVFADGDMVFQWHMDTFDLPAGAELVARGDLVPHQAYRVGERAWGLQFHFEIDAAELELWLGEVAHLDLKTVWGKTHDEIRAEASRFMSGHEGRGREVFHRFTQVARSRA